jgi:hypothetical protein
MKKKTHRHINGRTYLMHIKCSLSEMTSPTATKLGMAFRFQVMNVSKL